jgi:hypothetical protein
LFFILFDLNVFEQRKFGVQGLCQTKFAWIGCKIFCTDIQENEAPAPKVGQGLDFYGGWQRA